MARAVNTDARYGDLNEAGRNEEAMADAYGAWGDGSLPKQTEIAVRGVFNRIKQFFVGLREEAQRAVGGKPPTAEELFAAIEGGEMAPALGMAHRFNTVRRRLVSGLRSHSTRSGISGLARCSWRAWTCSWSPGWREPRWR